MKRFVGDRPGNDLPHALHRAAAREIEQHDKARKELHAFGKGRESGNLRRKIALVAADLIEEVMLSRHRFILKEFVINRLRKPERLDEMRICRNVHGLASGKTRKHHADLGLLEARKIRIHIGP